MLVAIIALFLQTERGSMFSETAEKETFFTRGTQKLSWLDVREACGNKSAVILPSTWAARALGLMHVGEFAWIDGKQYRFCHTKKNANTTIEQCRYVTARKEDPRENFTYICSSGTDYAVKDEMLPYVDAIKQCMKSKTSLLAVNTFVLPIVVPLYRTYWIGNYSDSRINSSLSPGQTVTEMCIGIVKLDHDKSEFATASCDENHTVICDMSGVDTALTLTTSDDKMIPPLGDIKAKEFQTNGKTIIFISSGVISGVLLLVIAIIVIVLYRKWKLKQNLPYQSKSQQRICAAQRRRDREMFPEDNVIGRDVESERKLFPSNSFKGNYRPQVHNYNSGDSKADFGYDKSESQTASSLNPIDDKDSSDHSHLHDYAMLAKHAAVCGKTLSSGSQKYLFPAREGSTIPTVPEKMTMHRKETEWIDLMHTKDKIPYENYRMVNQPSEYQAINLISN